MNTKNFAIKNPKFPAAKENSYVEEGHALRQSTVDMLVESFKYQSNPVQKNTSQQQPEVKNLFSLVSSTFNNNRENSEASISSQHSESSKKIARKTKELAPREEDSNNSNYFYEEESKNSVNSRLVQIESYIKNEFAITRRAIEEIDKRDLAQHKKLDAYTKEIDNSMKRGFGLLVDQVNAKFLNFDRSILNLQEEGLVNKNTVELLKTTVGAQLDEMAARLDRNQKYELDLKQSRELSSAQHMNAAQQAQLEHLTEKIAKLQEQIAIMATKLTVEKKKSSQTEGTGPEAYDRTTIDKLRLEFEQILKARDLEILKRMGEFEKVLRCLDDSIEKINGEFTRVLNEHIIPRLMKLESQETRGDHIKITEELETLKTELEDRIKKSKIVYVRRLNESEKQVVSEASSLMDSYVIGEDNCLQDAQGHYLVDQSNQRIRVSEDQLYFLAARGITIVNPL